MKERPEAKKKVNHARGIDPFEESDNPHAVIQEWGNIISSFPTEEYGDEAEWNYWRRKCTTIDLQILFETRED